MPVPVEAFVCLSCDRTFYKVRSSGRKPHRCPPCRAPRIAETHRRPNVVGRGECDWCGESFVIPPGAGGRGGDGRRFCSLACRRARPKTSAVRYYDCQECGRLFASRSTKGANTCGLECRKVQETRRTRDYLRRYKAEHGVRYEDRYPDRHRYAGYTEARRRNDAARRARKAGALVEVFDHVEVFDRDGWVCGLCSEPVDRELRYPDPHSSSLDHVLPLSLGGDHSRANTRLAHLTCNVRRGAARGEDLAAPQADAA